MGRCSPVLQFRSQIPLDDSSRAPRLRNASRSQILRPTVQPHQSFCSYSAPFFCAIFPIVSTCHPMTLLGAKSYLGLPPPRCAHGFTRLQMSGSLTIARRVGSDTSATATVAATAAAVPYRLINPGWELPCHLTKTASKHA